MYINFQQNQINRSVKSVDTNLFAKYRKLHKSATTNSNFAKIDYFRHASADMACISIFSKIESVDQSEL